MRAFPQYTLDDYLFRLTAAQIQFLAVDNTHTKYLKGTDKKIWNGYKDAYEAQKKLEGFMSGLKIPKELQKGQEYDIPLNKKQKRKTKADK